MAAGSEDSSEMVFDPRWAEGEPCSPLAPISQVRDELRWQFLLDQDIQDLIGNEVFAEQWSTGSVDLTVCDMTLIE